MDFVRKKKEVKKTFHAFLGINQTKSLFAT